MIEFKLKVRKILHQYYPEIIIDIEQKITERKAKMINCFIDNWSPYKIVHYKNCSVLIPLGISYEK